MSFTRQMRGGGDTVQPPSDAETLQEAPQELFTPEESKAHFGVDGTLREAFVIGDQRFGVFDISDSPSYHDADPARYPFVDGNTGVRTDRDFVILQFDAEGRVNGDQLKGLRYGEEVTLGRQHNADRFQYDDTVSREHVKISLSPEGKVTVEDLGSTNGTGTASRAEVMEAFNMYADPEVAKQQVEGLFSPEESRELFGVDGTLVEAVEIGDQRFGVFDISNGEVFDPNDPVRAPFGRDGALIRADREHVILQFDAQGRVSDKRVKGLMHGEEVTLGRRHHATRFDYDPHVSGEHVSIKLTPAGELTVDDLNSTNGTEFLTRDSIQAKFGLNNRGERAPQPAETHAEAVESLVKGHELSAEAEQVLQNETLAPAEMVVIDGKQFAISKVIGGSSREKAVLYTEDKDGKTVARFLYKSMSDGGWRVAAGIDGRRYIKGAERHYTQETKLHETILDALDDAERVTDVEQNAPASQVIDRAFQIGLDEGHNRFSAEADFVKIKGKYSALERLSAGDLGANRTTTEQAYQTLDDINRALEIGENRRGNIMPDFEGGPIQRTTREHTILGRVTFERFAAKINGRDAYWEFGDDGNGRVWIDKIAFAETGTTTYGTADEVIESGLLTSKPMEYAQQADAIRPEDRPAASGNYVDITPFLANLTPIRRYKAQKNVIRAQ